ncbi:hypothetical protein [Crateriforma conspicua]|uniref:Uncharacterized protein n=1 Tax=Crateriforma conspicua TaxID=2527996 RepID=A0A5C6FPS1_9PLAN|nr:hypothetical protein [Crateriforma conspicua]TWU62486.1 hypothetical protein V7x_42210 [Crateriforma conspicua]
MNATKPHSTLWIVATALAAIQAMQTNAEDSPWTRDNRIAISADGNPHADADDVGATPLTMAVLAKAGLQDNLVHFDFNNFLEYERIDPEENRMWQSAMGAQARFGFDRNRFFDAAIEPNHAIEHLTSVINESTANDPLYLIAAGPMELIYRALEASDAEARKHVKIVSHHDYNEYFKPRLWHRNWNDIQRLVPEIGYLRIKDQNGSKGQGLKGSSNDDFRWLKDHTDSKLNWVYDRIAAGKPDVSDAGMLTWLIGINGKDTVVSIAEMKDWFGTDSIDVSDNPQTPADAPAGVTPDVVPPHGQSIFKEVDGKLVIEAESVPLTDDWVVETSESDFSGDGYIRWMPSWIHKISHQHQGVLMYRLRITNAGEYRMALRSSHKGAPERDKWNDCWTLMGLNPVHPYGITRKTYHAINQESFDSGTGFTWHTTHDNYGSVAKSDGPFSTPVYQLDQGDHYFWICGRSGGYRIDKIHFFKQGIDGFKDDTEPATPIIAVDHDQSEPQR